ncbi:MAG: CubicO group peptidase (beta-lactamase class C family) [Salibacteraceae bacterium]|jgi:CubicO group peptidase (beta-lactamase class C family)
MTKKFIILFQLITFFNVTGFSQSNYQDYRNLPKDRKGKIIAEFIDAYNTFDKTVFSTFIKKDFSKNFLDDYTIESHIQFYTEHQRYLGKYEFACIRHYEANEAINNLSFLVKNQQYNSFLEFKIVYDSLDGKIDNLTFRPFESSPPPSYIDKNTMSESEFIDSAKELVASLADNDTFSGTVLIAKGNKVLFEFATGEASKRFHTPNDLNTKINLGSINKMFTATAILKLVEQGKLSLSDTISKFVDTSWFDISILDKITVHQLLTHTSGLGNFFNNDFINGSRDLFRDVNDFKKLIAHDTLKFEPGTQFEYSNVGFVLLGSIIENITNMSYFKYMRVHIFSPLGMDNTDCFEMDIPIENLAIGYIVAENKVGWNNNIFLHVIKGGPSGGGFSTVKDLHKFAIALLENKIISENSIKLLWSTHQNAGRFGEGLGYESYGYGTMINTEKHKQALGHLGGFPGISAGFTVFPKNEYIICVLSNYDHSGIILSNHLKKLAFKVK